MSFAARLEREWIFLSGLVRTLVRVRSISAHSPNLVTDDLEAAVDRWRERPALSFEGRDAHLWRDGRAGQPLRPLGRQDAGLRRGDVVALLMPNRIEYLPIWYGLSKVGVVTALINNQLTGDALAHCLNVSGAAPLPGRRRDLRRRSRPPRPAAPRRSSEWTLGEAHGDQRDLAQALKSCSSLRPDRARREGLTAADTALFIFTSGTTGLPKAARITHMRAQLYMRGFAGATDARAGRPDLRHAAVLPRHRRPLRRWARRC